MNKFEKDDRDLGKLFTTTLVEEPAKDINRKIITRIEKYQAKKNQLSRFPWVGVAVITILLVSITYLMFTKNTFPNSTFFTLPELKNITIQFNFNPLYSLALAAMAVASWALILIENRRNKQIS